MDSKTKKITIAVLILTIFVMSVAYAILYQELRIDGNASVVASWKVDITGIQEGNKTGEATSLSIPTYTNSTATFNARLKNVTDSIEYVVTVKNNGRIDAKLSSIITTKSEDNTIIYEISGVSENDVLKAGEATYITVKISCNPTITSVNEDTSSNITIVFNYIQNV